MKGFKKSNFITIQGFAIVDFKLSGNELVLYSLIFGFSQDGDSVFSGSLSYIMSALNCSRPTAVKTLNSLCDKGLIIKNEFDNRGVKFTDYKVDLSKVDYSGKETLPDGNKTDHNGKETLLPSKETLKKGSKETLPNKDILDTDSNTNNKKYPDIEEFVSYAIEELEKRGEVRAYEYEFSLRDKYELWSSANWKDGYGNKILNWRSKIKNGFKYLHRYTNTNINNQNKVGKTDGNDRMESIGLFVTDSK